MNKTESYTELSAQIMRNFRRGMLTNHFAAKDKLTRDIAKGLVYTHESENGLLILTDRETHYYLNFYLHSPALADEIPYADRPTVLEISKKYGDTSFTDTEAGFVSRGFEHAFRRRRYSLSPTDMNIAITEDVRYASRDDLGDVMDLLRASFAPLTGCLPHGDELFTDTDRVLTITDNGKPAALLHYREDRKSIEIRHLCTAESCRGRGLASCLVGEAVKIAADESKKISVWVRDGYSQAEAVYKKHGFSADGMISDVYIRHTNNKA